MKHLTKTVNDHGLVEQLQQGIHWYEDYSRALNGKLKAMEESVEATISEYQRKLQEVEDRELEALKQMEELRRKVEHLQRLLELDGRKYVPTPEEVDTMKWVEEFQLSRQDFQRWREEQRTLELPALT